MSTERLERAKAAAIERFPGLELTSPALTDYLTSEGRLEREAHWAESCLAWCCGDGQVVALRHFEAAYFPAAREVLRVLNVDAATVEDLLQTLRARFFVGSSPKVLEYAGRGSLEGWVRATAGRLGLDVHRSTKARTEEELFESACPTQLEADADRRVFTSAWREAFRQALSTLSSRERALLKLHLVDGSTIDAIGELYSVHRSTAARWLERIRDTLKQRTYDALRELKGLHEAELQSLTKLVLSVVDVSLESQLRR